MSYLLLVCIGWVFKVLWSTVVETPYTLEWTKFTASLLTAVETTFTSEFTACPWLETPIGEEETLLVCEVSITPIILVECGTWACEESGGSESSR